MKYLERIPGPGFIPASYFDGLLKQFESGTKGMNNSHTTTPVGKRKRSSEGREKPDKSRPTVTVRAVLCAANGDYCGRIIAQELHAAAALGVKPGEVPVIVFDTPEGHFGAIRAVPKKLRKQVVRIRIRYEQKET